MTTLADFTTMLTPRYIDAGAQRLEPKGTTNRIGNYSSVNFMLDARADVWYAMIANKPSVA